MAVGTEKAVGTAEGAAVGLVGASEGLVVEA